MSTAALKKEHRMPSKQRREKAANILCLILLILLGLIVRVILRHRRKAV